MHDKKTKILVVDDELELINLLERILTKKGFQVEIAADGLEALNMFKYDFHDIVIVDYKIPSIDGINLAQKIKKLNPITEIILMTGYTTLDLAIAALKSDTFDYFLKPIKVDEIVQSINRAIEKQMKLKITTQQYNEITIVDF